MSSHAILYGRPAATLIPGPSLVISRASDGMTTGSMDFTCRKGDINTPLVQSKLVKGTLISVLYPDIGTGFAFLRVDSWVNRDEPGAYSTISVEFKGADVSGEDYTFEGSVVYTRNNALRDESIFNHPKYLADVTGQTRTTIKGGADGLCFKSNSSYEIVTTSSGSAVETLTDPKYRWWWDYIVEKGNTTYEKATSEWTKSGTGKGGLRAADFAAFGKVDDPPGNPSAPSGDVWVFSGATEQIAVSGDGANSYSKTWTSGDPNKYNDVVYGDAEAGA